MYFANPWGLLGLLALPVILAIHLYRRRFPVLVLAGSHLWQSETRQTLAGRRRETLPITASLLLELLAALLLAIVLAEPHFGEMDRVLHLVAVLDNSASMQGRPPGAQETSFRDAAVAELGRRMDAAPRGSVITLILTGVRPELLAGPAVSWEQAQASLAGWRPSAPRHAFDAAWDLGLQLVERRGELLFLTDRMPPAADRPLAGAAPAVATGEKVPPADETGLPPAATDSLPSQRMEVVSFGRRLENVALGAARWTFDSATGQGNVFLRVRNYGRQPARCVVRGRHGTTVVFQQTVSLEPGAATSVQAGIKGGAGALLIEVESPEDGLAIDNQVQLVEPRVRMVTYAITLPKGDASREVLNVLHALPDVQPGPVDSAVLRFSPASRLPATASRAWWLGIGPLSESEADRKQAVDLGGPYLLEKRNPLLDGVVLDGVVWGGVQPLTLSATPLVSAGRHPLLSRLDATSSPAYLLNIDLARSNLAASPDWPILLSNLVELRRNDLPGLQRWNYRLGENIAFRLYEGTPAAEPPPLTLVSAQRVKPLLTAPFVEIAAPAETGLYDIRSGDNSIGRFAVNFEDAEESDLRFLSPGRRAPVQETAGSEFMLDNPYSWVLMLLMALIAAVAFCDWKVLKNG